MRDLGKGRLGAALEDHRTLALGDIARIHEGHNGFILVVACAAREWRVGPKDPGLRLEAVRLRAGPERAGQREQQPGAAAGVVGRAVTQRKGHGDIGLQIAA